MAAVLKDPKTLPAPAPIHQLHHYAYRAKDAEETRHFYEDILGLPVYEFGLVLTVLAAVLTLWSMIAYLVAAAPELRGSRGA